MKFWFPAVALGVLLRVLLAIHTYADPVKSINSDSTSFETPARNLLNGRGLVGDLSQQPDTPIFFRTPGYPVFIALIYALPFAGGVERLALLIAQALLWGATIWLVWLTARERLNRSELGAAIAAFVIALDPMCLWASGVVMSETLFVFLIAAFMYFVWARPPRRLPVRASCSALRLWCARSVIG